MVFSFLTIFQESGGSFNTLTLAYLHVKIKFTPRNVIKWNAKTPFKSRRIEADIFMTKGGPFDSD
jgi:hypothetical protein